MDLIYTNAKREDIGVLKDFSLDLAFGSGENDFEVTVSRGNHVAEAGGYIYIQGTEYGGLIDAIKSDTAEEEVTYSGRTWHGLLNSKILEPDSGEDYLTVSGEANTVLGALISRMGLGDIFQAASTASGINIARYQFARYISGYDGICKMLSSAGAKLHMEHDGFNVIISALPIHDYTQDGVDSDQTTLTVLKTKNKVNHLICLGDGELAERTVVHLYADENGNISRTQTFTGVDEYAATYNYTGAEDEEKLIEGGTERFKELLQQDELKIDVEEIGDIYDIGDIIGASDVVTGISIAVPVSKKIVKIDGDSVTVDVVTNTESARRITTTGEDLSGGGLSPGSVTTDHLADGAVTTPKIADGAVTPAKLSFTPITPLDVYPVGAIYTSTDSTSPAAKWGGTWEKIYADYDVIYTGGNIIYDYLEIAKAVTTPTGLIGAYSDAIFGELFRKYGIPPGYHAAFRLTAQMSGNGAGTLGLYLNNLGMTAGSPWGAATYRAIMASQIYRKDAIVYEPVVGYTTNGINLKYTASADMTGVLRAWDITVHGYYVSDDIVYKWKRTA